MIERTGFAIRKSEFRSLTIANYACEKVKAWQGEVPESPENDAMRGGSARL